MKHRIVHSINLADRLPDYARQLGVPLDELREAYQWMLAHNAAFEEPLRRGGGMRCFISFVDIEKTIPHPLARRFFALLRDELGVVLVPKYGVNWVTVKDRWLRGWEQLYNILINKIPIHNLRLAWLRAGGARIGKGSAVWRHTEVIGIENLRIGEDTCIGWHCQLDARAGLTIGNHVTVASHVIMIAGGHDVKAPEFWAIANPVRVDDYAWIATRAMLLGGAHVGYGAVVAANTVINARQVEPYQIVGGDGAKLLGERAHDPNYKVGGKGLFTLFH